MSFKFMQQKLRVTVLVVERKRKILIENHSPIGSENGYCFSRKVRESQAEYEQPAAEQDRSPRDLLTCPN